MHRLLAPDRQPREPVVPFHSCSDAPADLPNICVIGRNVLSGAGTAVVVQTGARTYFGELAGMVIRQREPTSFHLV